MAEFAPGVEFHEEPSKHFFVYRPGRPALRLDLEIDLESQSVRFGTSSSATGILQFRELASGEMRFRNGEKLMTVEEARDLLLKSFVS